MVTLQDLDETVSDLSRVGAEMAERLLRIHGNDFIKCPCKTCDSARDCLGQ